MAGVSVRISSKELSALTGRLNKMVQRAEDLRPAMQEIGEYMQRSTVNRILRQKKSPEGDPWAELSELTISLKGHDRPLFQSGELADSINLKSVTNRGFTLQAGAKHASFQQKGVRKVRGKYRSNKPSPQIPPRPFMGFSQENIKRISQILREYVFDK